jgi:hypothetical protein
MDDVHNPDDAAATERTPADHDDPPAHVSKHSQRPWQRRRYQVVAAVGVAAILGTGVLAAQYLDRRSETASEDRVDLGEPHSTIASVPSTAPTSARASASSSPTRNAPAQPAPPAMPAVVPSVSTSGTLPKDHRTLKVISARGDLSGAHELTWVADSGHRVGDALCTQNFRFDANSPARERPTMLLCWRTSASRSVLTITVDIDNRPSEKASVATINKVWSKLG